MGGTTQKDDREQKWSLFEMTLAQAELRNATCFSSFLFGENLRHLLIHSLHNSM